MASKLWLVDYLTDTVILNPQWIIYRGWQNTIENLTLRLPFNTQCIHRITLLHIEIYPIVLNIRSLYVNVWFLQLWISQWHQAFTQNLVCLILICVNISIFLYLVLSVWSWLKHIIHRIFDCLIFDIELRLIWCNTECRISLWYDHCLSVLILTIWYYSINHFIRLGWWSWAMHILFKVTLLSSRWRLLLCRLRRLLFPILNWRYL